MEFKIISNLMLSILISIAFGLFIGIISGSIFLGILITSIIMSIRVLCMFIMGIDEGYPIIDGIVSGFFLVLAIRLTAYLIFFYLK